MLSLLLLSLLFHLFQMLVKEHYSSSSLQCFIFPLYLTALIFEVLWNLLIRCCSVVAVYVTAAALARRVFEAEPQNKTKQNRTEQKSNEGSPNHWRTGTRHAHTVRQPYGPTSRQAKTHSSQQQRTVIVSGPLIFPRLFTWVETSTLYGSSKCFWLVNTAWQTRFCSYWCCFYCYCYQIGIGSDFSTRGKKSRHLPRCCFPGTLALFQRQ